MRSINATMKEELVGLYVQIRELRQQETTAISTTPKPVAYKLPTDQTLGAAVKASTKAVEAAKTSNHVSDTLLQNFLNKPKMPWEEG